MTAKELFDKMLEENDECTSTEMMIYFAKYHVIKALKQASEKAKQIENPYAYAGNTGSEYSVDLIIDNESILNAYSLDNVC